MRFLLAIVFVTMLLVAGCPGGGPQEGTPSGQPGAPSGQMGTEDGAQSGGETGAQEGGESGSQEQAGTPFESWDMQEMMAGGQPVHCTVTYSMEGQTSTSEVWIKGENMRVESTSSMEGETYETIAVIKGEVVYVSGGAAMGTEEDCDWVKMDYQRLEECIPESEESVASEMTAYDYQETYEEAPAEYNCDYGTFGDEKFNTPGKVCDLTEELCTLYESIESGSGVPGMDPEEVCGSYTGEEYAQCMQAFGLE
ncbi:hypothetical protein GF412_02790 [Candidatus Micrarchaeota archaeon]|nr:hypothetical protein [Candidatus Micrarchaeota archaeon]MBD3417885.1 hypothetical protein [Candidatus Micrarchaeota archaeon]